MTLSLHPEAQARQSFWPGIACKFTEFLVVNAYKQMEDKVDLISHAVALLGTSPSDGMTASGGAKSCRGECNDL